MATIEVIGAGWGRTGTSSFKKAMEILGHQTYHMVDVHKCKDCDFWIDAYEKNGTVEFEKVFNRPGNKYTASCDYPSAYFWEEQLKKYPNAKVILTKRDPESWYKSCTETIFCMAPNYPGCSIGTKVMLLLGLPAPNFYFLSKILFEAPPFNGDFSKANAIRAFNEHNNNVIARCPSEKLLVFEAKDGWEPLCKFLGKPIPDVPYPHVNDTEHFRKIVKGTTMAGTAILFFSAAAVVGLVAYVYQNYVH